MLGRKEIDASSEEWATTDYRIQMITGKSSIQIVNLFAYPCAQSEVAHPHTAGVQNRGRPTCD